MTSTATIPSELVSAAAAGADGATEKALGVLNMLHNLPPMERVELERMVESLSQCNTVNKDDNGSNINVSDESTNDDGSAFHSKPVVDAFWKAHTIRTCVAAVDDPTNTTPFSASLMDHILTKVDDYQTARYKAKGVTARCTVSVLSVVEPEQEENSEDPRTLEDAIGSEPLATTTPTTPAASTTTTTTPGVMMVRTYAEHLDAGNCGTGSWRAEWRIVPCPPLSSSSSSSSSSDTDTSTEQQHPREAQIDGFIQVHVHSFEGTANGQTRSKRTFAPTVVKNANEEVVNSLVAQFETNTTGSLLSYAQNLATLIVDKIAEYEEEFHANLSAALALTSSSSSSESSVDDALRKLRRILPVTKTRFKWDSAAQRNVQLLNARQGSTGSSKSSATKKASQ